MGRPTKKQSSIGSHPSLWKDDELPQSPARLPAKKHRPINFPLWTHNKARLIQEYLRLFIYITKHGTYIDGFAGPQDPKHLETWAAKKVLEIEPKWLRDFWLCENDPAKIKRLKALKAKHESQKRKIDVLEGDFNTAVYEILASGRITEKTATFALLDQRTFECEWRTVVALSKHKSQTKIEIFYFFATGWVDRSLGAVKAPGTIAKVQSWWGRKDWKDLKGLNGTVRALKVAKRFEDELGYMQAKVYAIHSEKHGGRIMYHMIHATDHSDATPLMVRAYRKVSGRSELGADASQEDFEGLWKKIENDED